MSLEYTEHTNPCPDFQKCAVGGRANQTMVPSALSGWKSHASPVFPTTWGHGSDSSRVKDLPLCYCEEETGGKIHKKKKKKKNPMGTQWLLPKKNYGKKNLPVKPWETLLGRPSSRSRSIVASPSPSLQDTKAFCKL